MTDYVHTSKSQIQTVVGGPEVAEADIRFRCDCGFEGDVDETMAHAMAVFASFDLPQN